MRHSHPKRLDITMKINRTQERGHPRKSGWMMSWRKCPVVKVGLH